MINERDIIRMTDLTCDICESAKFAVVPGWETMQALKCTNPECDQYHYFIAGRLHCCNTINTHNMMKNHSTEVLKKALEVPVNFFR